MITVYRFLIVVLIFVTLVSCSTTIATNAPTPIAPQPSSPSLGGAEHLPTFTARPLSTPLPSKTPDLTETAYIHSSISAQLAEQTLVAQYPRVCENLSSSRKFSPNGLWLEEMCYSEDDYDLVLTLSNSKVQVLWKFLYQDHIPKMDFVPDGGMTVVHWSNDGRYAYFFSHLGGDGGECFYEGGDRGSGLFRVDLQTGQSTVILPPNNEFWWYGFSLSPTDRRLVYGIRARNLKILDITTGESISIVSDDNIDETGGFLWSDDGLKLVYSALTRDSNGEREDYSLRLVDVQSGSERILLESPRSCFAALSWTEDSILTLTKNYNESLIEFDLNSNTIISETITP